MAKHIRCLEAEQPRHRRCPGADVGELKRKLRHAGRDIVQRESTFPRENHARSTIPVHPGAAARRRQAPPNFASWVTTQCGPNVASIHQHVTAFEKDGILCCERPLLSQFCVTCRWEFRLSRLVETLDDVDVDRITGFGRRDAWKTVFPSTSAATAQDQALFRSNPGPMKEWLIAFSEPTIIIIDALALVMIVIGTVEAFAKGLSAMLPSPSGYAAREIWLRFGRWLVAALTFQLAADIVETSITESWEAIRSIAAIAVIRTFLDYFLEIDLTEIRERQKRHAEGAILPPTKPDDYSGARSGAMPGETPGGS